MSLKHYLGTYIDAYVNDPENVSVGEVLELVESALVELGEVEYALKVTENGYLPAYDEDIRFATHSRLTLPFKPVNEYYPAYVKNAVPLETLVGDPVSGYSVEETESLKEETGA